MFMGGRFKEMSPFFKAINQQSTWAIDMFCDQGADIQGQEIGGMNPIIYSAKRGFDEICLYLCLRVKNIDIEDPTTGKTVFQIYLQKKNTERMRQLVMRGADINFISQKRGQTALHYALLKCYPQKIVKFLLEMGANPHIEDKNGQDCCDIADGVMKYKNIKQLTKKLCRTNANLRISYEQALAHSRIKKKFMEQVDDHTAIQRSSKVSQVDLDNLSEFNQRMQQIDVEKISQKLLRQKMKVISESQPDVSSSVNS
jgi:ankyrin repeat protein